MLACPVTQVPFHQSFSNNSDNSNIHFGHFSVPQWQLAVDHDDDLYLYHVVPNNNNSNNHVGYVAASASDVVVRTIYVLLTSFFSSDNLHPGHEDYRRLDYGQAA